MHMQSYRRNRGVHFHNIGLSGVNEMETKGWKMLTLAGAMKYLGHEGVINTFSHHNCVYEFRFDKYVKKVS